ncbi:transcriptional regulator [Colwellia sp. M166]|uniref:ChrR family anti-sigma-E factor n=1 Tax=Colwellia sp. M166 TaxID=2583805 RepID=UPI00211EBEC6|nr:ChrR family anti-sigma-E factor [Colwellia sp. M166]UUO23342.1 transcriptional regulator [Colwellia sp. M166]|tara:strand:- start:35266 stop:35949 length:684 start_codon:yes stop_codon:yes gene_type:complete
MIKHHPKFSLLQSFVDGDLPASLAAGIAIHAEMCPLCQQKVTQLTEQVAEASFEESFDAEFIVDDADTKAAELDFDDIIGQITASDDVEPMKAASVERSVSFKGTQYVLPNALRNMSLGKTAQIGKLSRARILLDEGGIHTNLLHIGAGGSIPEHTHKGFELTLLLAGTFADEQGEYVQGDFIMLDKRHQHQPATEQGCLCYTVANDALHFTQGINKLLNPIGSFIY